MGKYLTTHLPALYYTEPNDIYNFLDALEPTVDFGRQKCETLPNLANVDKCPVEYLTYLAAATNALLMGDNPALWRGQIKQWPEILRLKGTEKSVKLLLHAMGFNRFGIKTYWRDANGDYTTEKPDGEPFKGEDGIWYNSRTHYFSITVYWTGGSDAGSEPDSDTLDFIKKWLPRVKPIHAELLSYEAGLAISEPYDGPAGEHLTIRPTTQLTDTVPITEPGHEAFAPTYHMGLVESPWTQHRYSDEGLEYTPNIGGITYSGVGGDVEYLSFGVGTGITDKAQSTDSIINALYVVIK